MPTNKKSPTPSILQRMFGVMSDDMSPEIKKSWEMMQREMPDETASTNRLTTMGPLTKLFHGNDYAVTNPLTKVISLNTDLINKDKADIPTTLFHELNHIKQGPSGFLKNLFNSDKLENEAYNAEDMRNKKRIGFGRDINLPLQK